MHTRTAVFVVTLLLIPVWCRAQPAPGPLPPPVPGAGSPATALDLTRVNYFDLGIRGTGFEEGSDEARYQRYRDLGNGVTLDTFRFFGESGQQRFTAVAEHTGYRDQRYVLGLN